MFMNVLGIIKKYYAPGSKAYKVLLTHARLVTRKALLIARKVPELKPDINFIKEASMLHDIGIFMTNAPLLGCHGGHSYICHGVLGRELLEKEGLPKHALVCERHVGVGLTIVDVKKLGVPCLPLRNMTPRSVEEEIICYADKFYSKHPNKLHREKSILEVREQIKKWGEDNLRRFDELHVKFSGNERIY